MKTQPLRQDKHCLNCGTEVPERYCTHCGQENAIPHESFGHLVKHFVADVLHYDSQFLTTIQYLLFRPGRLTKEYLAGRRVAYVNPIKLYIFISFVFFLTLSIVSHSSEVHGDDPEETAALERKKEKDKKKNKELPNVINILSEVKDSVSRDIKKDFKEGITLPEVDSLDISKLAKDTLVHKKSNIFGYHSLQEYDAVQKSLPAGKADKWAKRVLIRRLLYLSERKNGDDEWAYILELLEHNYPKLMFVLLPFFALFLKMMHRKKHWYYADHAIFALHVHCFAFIVFFVALVLGALVNYSFTGWGILLALIYLVLALKNTYQQSFRRSLFKAVMLLMFYSCAIGFVFMCFLLLAFAVIL